MICSVLFHSSIPIINCFLSQPANRELWGSGMNGLGNHAKLEKPLLILSPVF